MRTVAGIFVGGGARRMEGIAKGLLVAPDQRTLIARWLTLFTELGLPVVLVGEQAAYRDLRVPALSDEPAKVGPIGGLIALLSHANEARVIAVACDMPWVSRPLLERFLQERPEAPALAARHQGHWRPFPARYDARVVLPVARRCLELGRRALHQVLAACEAEALDLGETELAQLGDWDTKEDVIRDGGSWPNS